MCSSFSSFVCTVLIVKHRWISRTVFVIGLLVALPSLVTAQEATIVGTITDPNSGAIADIPRAKSELAKHCTEITLTPEGRTYQISGDWNLLGGRSDGAGGPVCTT